MKRLITLCLLAYIITLFMRGNAFTIDDIKIRHFHKPEWEMPFLTSDQKKQIGSVLSQTFHFIKQSGDAYSFVSHDKKYKIKLMKQKPMSELTWAHFLPLPTKLNPFLTKASKKKKSLRAHFITKSKEQLKNQKNLYHHFNRTKYINKKTPFIDNKGKRHYIDMDDVEFILRKNG
ncbi:MAG: hypothetical protein SP1CHLAM54_05890 [Chlamydiia bacterium]|nr:hypothetical protein [Chlamydiia bacterium]MCH9615499.1 hypothetical protein [Chlamydiia bacterium]MCH9629154.1 hypothetical protein [Chlamydiia bacterium]